MYSGVSCNLDQSILKTILPLFSKAEIECIEWSFDTVYQHSQIPHWFEELLLYFGSNGRLIGHGVFYSLFSGKFSPDQKSWLQDLESKSTKYTFDHITEHFGFMTGKDFHHGAPLNVPLTETTLELAQDRIKRISKVCNRPVGLENLAFCYGPEDVKTQGTFLEKILHPINGFIILDLHNIYCQAHNFDLSFDEILNFYPLHLVREIHISGGSFEESQSDSAKTIRRDTHDEKVPSIVFEYLEKTLPLVPNLKFIILESLGTGLKTKQQQDQFQQDFIHMKSIVKNAQTKTIQNHFLPPANLSLSEKPFESVQIYNEQMKLSSILEESASLQEVKNNLELNKQLFSTWNVDSWNTDMVDTAFRIAQKWK